MSFKKPNPLDNNLKSIDPLQKSYINKNENDSCQESIDGLDFGYQKNPFDVGKLF